MHVVADDLKASTHTLPVPVQWSPASLSHWPPCDDPVQLVADDLKTSAGHEPLDPVQVSAWSHWPAEARHTVLLDWKTSTQVFAVPEQWSAASSSHTPPCDVPVQLVADDLKTSAGQLPLDPVQFSATSHWPADPRQTVALDLNASTHVFAVPRQWSPGSLSQAPPWELPVHVVDDDANPSVGQEPLVPVQFSATSH